MTKLFPTIQIILDLCAAGAYWYYGNWKMTVYWVAAAVITASVTY